jgi:ribosomal protein L11 methyltransferase
MPWLQLSIEANQDNSEDLSDLLSQAGAVAVTLQDAEDKPIFEPPPGTTPLWQQIILTGLFKADVDMNCVLGFIKSELGSLPEYKLNPLEDKDWIRAWMDDFKPTRFGSRLWVCPSWHTPVDDKAVNLMLDPGLAFGTGTHPTTALCLGWLDAHFSEPVDVIDYGCGSGILSIAAGLLGSPHVYAVDLDPQALIATRGNAEKNQVQEKIETFTVERFNKEHAALKCDLLLANILAGPLVELSPLLASHVSIRGRIVLSGILAEQADKIIQAYQQWFTINDITQQEDWVRIVATKNP